MDLGVRVTTCILPWCSSVYVCVWLCVWKRERVCVWHVSLWVSWVGVFVTTHLFWIWRGAQNVHCLLSSASVLSSAHSPTLLQLPVTCSFSQFLIWLLIHSFIYCFDGDHSCMPQGLPLCIVSNESWIRVCEICVYFTVPVGSLGMQHEWTTFHLWL